MKKNLTAFIVTIFVMVAGACISYAAFPVANNAATQTVSTANATTNAEITAQMEEYSNAMSVARTSAPAAPAPSGGKSQIVAFILCLVIGGLGIHRFYLGYTWQGVVQLLTGGGCGIWALIDLIRIATGDLGPKNGRYAKTF